MTVDYATASHYALQLQLLTGFISLRDDVIDTELRLAASRLGLVLGEMRFSSVDDGDDENARVWDDLMRIGLEDALQILHRRQKIAAAVQRVAGGIGLGGQPIARQPAEKVRKGL